MPCAVQQPSRHVRRLETWKRVWVSAHPPDSTREQCYRGSSAEDTTPEVTPLSSRAWGMWLLPGGAARLSSLFLFPPSPPLLPSNIQKFIALRPKKTEHVPSILLFSLSAGVSPSEIGSDYVLSCELSCTMQKSHYFFVICPFSLTWRNNDLL